MYQNGFNSNTNIVLKGGNGKTSFYNSLGYRWAEGIVPNNTFWRLSNLLKASHEVSDRVTVNGSVTFAISKPKNPQLNLGDPVLNGEIGPSYDANYYKHKYRGDQQTGMASSSYGDTYADVPGKSTWWAEANMNYYYSQRERRELGTGYMNDGGMYSVEKREKHQETLAGTFTYNNTFGDFGVGGFLRGEFYNFDEDRLYASTNGGLVIPGQYFLENSKNTLTTEGKTEGKKRILSAVYAVNLSWRDQVYLDLTGRNDWSSALVYKNKTGDYSYFYPSVSASWLLDETFREYLPDWISFLKIRGSWAQVGNDTDPFYIQQGYTLGRYPQSGGGFIYSTDPPSQLYQVPLKPEKKNSWEVGIDWRFWNSRVGIDATYYKENTKNQIIEIDVSSESGVGTYLVNAGNIQNKGIELALNVVPIRTRDWEWGLDFTYTRNRNKIIELHPSVQQYIRLDGDPDYGNYRVASIAQVDGPYGLLMTDSNPLRDDNGNIILNWDQSYHTTYYERSGKMEIVGDINPDFLGSISTNLRYKDFSLRVQLDMRYGGEVASYSNRYGAAYGMTESSLVGRDSKHGGITWTSRFNDTKGVTFHDGVIPEGIFNANTIVTTPGGKQVDVSGMSFRDAYLMGYVEPVHASVYTYFKNDWGNGVVNDDWLHELNYIALREISLSYRIPKKFAQKFGAQGLNLSVTGRNLGYLYNSLPNNINPESVRGNYSSAFRERGFQPVTASFMFSFGLDF